MSRRAHGGDAGGILQHFRQRIAGEAHELDQAARFHVGEGVLLQATDVEAEFDHVAAADPAGVVSQLIGVRSVALRIVELVAQGGESGDHNLAQAGVPGVRRDRRQAHRLVQIVVLILLVDLETDAVESQADFIEEPGEKMCVSASMAFCERLGTLLP